ncbi:hypothetical protein LIC_10960 [Leptospira interrogans serovar Copenhageni str. Fiocruz L1-130]|uniref:Uncharacterized protein n=1 Tax=Leptospira interrogans serogroup Icterohaemorrhagiae serovar copenhageni (strain Fiocruz L1-130) TaxID=267671 RepID=Q72TQ7_LEPIC|nr:hypothetical protein LIC_10960 [Leptospira interrogans serovar Copenhageni str. Fiocruz L1-130]
MFKVFSKTSNDIRCNSKSFNTSKSIFYENSFFTNSSILCFLFGGSSLFLGFFLGLIIFVFFDVFSIPSKPESRTHATSLGTAEVIITFSATLRSCVLPNIVFDKNKIALSLFVKIRF